MPMKTSSHMLRAVFPSAIADPLIAISSITHRAQSIKVSCIWQDGRSSESSVTLLPDHTLLLHACRSSVLQSDARDSLIPFDGRSDSVGITLESSGSTDDFVAFGLRTSDKNDNFTGVSFESPAIAPSPRSEYVGVPIGITDSPKGIFTPHLAVTNFSNSHAKLSVDLYSTTDGLTDHHHVMNVEVNPRSTREVKLRMSHADHDLHNTVVITNIDSPSSIVTSLMSKDADHHIQLPLVVKNEGELENGGMHPWSSSGKKSRLILWNYTDVDSRVWINLSTPNH